MESFIELARRRQSCRRYARRPVEPEKLEACIEAARLSPSACNSQPWGFTVVTRPVLLPEVAACVQQLGINAFTADCPAFVVVTEEKATIMKRLDGVVDSQHFASIDVGLAAAHLCLQAADLGLGTCIMGLFDEARLRRLLDIPAQSRVRLVIAVGYPAEDAPRPKQRKAMESVARFIR